MSAGGLVYLIVSAAIALVSLCTLGFSIFSPFSYLNPKTGPPDCKIQQFSVYTLNTSLANSTTATAIYFDITLKNEHRLSGNYYDALNVTIYREPDQGKGNRTALGNEVFPAFYQGYNKGTHRVANVSVASNIRNVSTTTFSVTLETAIHYRTMYGKRKKRHALRVDAKVNLDGQGMLIKGKHNKAVWLLDSESSVGRIQCGFVVKYYAPLLMALYFLLCAKHGC